MNDATRFPSLLPYLTPGEGRVRLDLSQPRLPVEAGALGHPFRVVQEGSSLSRLIEGVWMTDAGSPIQTVHLVLQRDAYPWLGREAGRLVNPIIEAIWQQTYAFCSSEESRVLMVLEEQLDEARRLLPFQSLFFCRDTRSFFHPPCPRCGLPLSLCRDDALLAASELLPYSRSLRRYLYCPSCASSEGAAFYAFERGAYDPPCVRDRFALLLDFCRVPASAGESCGFPCGPCEQADSCHGASSTLASRIVPVAFHPFYCLMFRALPLSAAEFLVTLSGGALADVREMLQRQGEMGRMKAIAQGATGEGERETFLFREDERFFLEVLYLKLCFMAEAVSKLRRGADAALEVEAQSTLDQVWVSLPDQSGHLPEVWSFGLHVADVFRPRAATASPSLSGLRGVLHAIGLTWFQTLLVNAGQDATQINEALDDLLDRRLARGDASGTAPAWDQAGAVFSAKNVFWRPEPLPRDVPWSIFWEEALQLGWTLLLASHTSTRDWSWAGFEWQVAALRERLRQTLFSPPGRVVDEQSLRETPTPDESPAIHAILTEIQQAWRKRAAPEPKDQTAAEPTAPPLAASASEEDTLPLGMQWRPEDEELVETILLTGAASREQEIELPGPAAPAISQEEMLPETIILQPKASPGATRHQRSAAQPAPEHAVPAGVEKSGQGVPAAQPPGDAVDRARAGPGIPVTEGDKGTGLKQAESEEPSFSEEDTFPGTDFELPKVPAEEEDLLMETIILSPRKDPGTPEKKE